jgi:hypothetical protein
MGKKQRRIGQVFEREAAKLLQVCFPDAERGYQYRGGDEQPDVDGTPFWVEAKRRANKSELSFPSLVKFLHKAHADAKAAKDKRIPILVTRLKGTPSTEILVSMFAHDFIRTVEKHFYRETEEYIPYVGLDERETND